MTPMSGGARKLALTSHITASVGWLGAVAAFMALAIAGVSTDDPSRLRSLYPAMEVMAWAVILPLGILSLITGVIQALGSKWGLWRHYWVIVKLVINVLATTVLLLYMESIGRLADFAASDQLIAGAQGALRDQAVLHSAAALIVLMGATVLSVYKPRGMTRYGQRMARRPPSSTGDHS